MTTLNLKNTYFGFTNDLKPLQRGKVEKSLDQLVRRDSIVSTEKESMYNLIKNGYRPEIEENYSYWSRRTEAMTKPKTLYKMEKDNSYYEINKTLYNYSVYLLENNFVNETIATEYIILEQKQKEELERIKNERLQQEQNERMKQRLEKEQERKAQHEAKRKHWIKSGNELLNSLSFNPIIEVLDFHYNEIESLYSNNDFNKETFYNNMINKFIEVLGNKDYCIHYAQYYVKNENEEDKTEFNIKSNPSMTLEKDIIFKAFNIELSDSARTISSKIKAVYENREYKGGNSQPKKKYEFYILNKSGEFEIKEGEKLNINGYVCFVYKDENNNYRVIESKTGLLLGSSQPSKKEAIYKAKEGIEKAGERMDELIENAIKTHGISPMYQDQETA